MDSLNTPVLLLVFNRPSQTHVVFKQIKKVRPKQLFIAADGPRSANSEDEKLCRKVKQIVSAINWNCEVKTLFRTKNLGCGKAVSEAISWFFTYVDEGIILEDDCKPNLSFFAYCQVQLERYRHNERIMHVAGVNFQLGIQRGFGSYYFSKYPHIWGWATWKRAWEHYDVTIQEWPLYKNSPDFKSWCFNSHELAFWSKVFDLTYSGNIDTWDYQWFYCIIKSKGLCVMPNLNLVSNLGFGKWATHTRDVDKRFAGKKTYNYILPDIQPDIEADNIADLFSFNEVFNNSSTVINVSNSYLKKAWLLLSRLLTSLSIVNRKVT